MEAKEIMDIKRLLREMVERVFEVLMAMMRESLMSPWTVTKPVSFLISQPVVAEAGRGGRVVMAEIRAEVAREDQAGQVTTAPVLCNLETAGGAA